MVGSKSGFGGVRPVLASALLGLMVGACGGAGGDPEVGLHPRLGQGNAAEIRAEYQALGLSLLPSDTGALGVNGVLGVGGVLDVHHGRGAATGPLDEGSGVAGGAGAGTEVAGIGLTRKTEHGVSQGGAPLYRGETIYMAATGTGGAAGAVGELTDKAAQAVVDAARYHLLAQRVVRAVNEARAQARTCGDVSLPAVGPLRWNPQVAYAALLESEWMLKNNKFSHGWDDGKYVWHRFEMVRYDWSQADENIAAGFRTLPEAMQAWIDSPSHCKALMRADIQDVGLAVVPGAGNSQYGSYWTMALGTPR